MKLLNIVWKTYSLKGKTLRYRITFHIHAQKPIKFQSSLIITKIRKKKQTYFGLKQTNFVLSLKLFQCFTLCMFIIV